MPSKTNTFKRSALFAIFSIAFLFTNLAMAEEHGDRKGRKDKHHYGSLKKIKEQLNLTKEQNKLLKDSQATFGKETMKKKHGELEAAQKDLEQALKSDATDEQIRAKFTALQKLQEDFAKTRFEKILYVRSILTPEQRTKFKTLIGR